MATIIHVGDVAASATGNGGLGVVSLGPTYNPALPSAAPIPAGLVATNMAERGALFTRDQVQLSDGVPNSIASYSCHTVSLVNYGKHISSSGLNLDADSVETGADQRWISGEGSYALVGPDVNNNYVTTWTAADGAGATLQFAVQAGEAAANPATGILVDPDSQYWSRAGQVNLPVVVDDQNPGLLTPGQAPVQTLTALFVVIPYETNWSFGDLMAFYDPTEYDPTQAKLACIRMDADELQLWVRGQQYTQRVVNPWATSSDPSQQLQGRRPIIVGWSIDVSEVNETTQTGKGSLVVIDPYSSSGIDYTFWNRSSDKRLGNYLLLGKVGAASIIPNPFNPAVIDMLMRLDIYEFNLWQRALSLDELLAAASKLDSIYGVVT